MKMIIYNYNNLWSCYNNFIIIIIILNDNYNNYEIIVYVCYASNNKSIVKNPKAFLFLKYFCKCNHEKLCITHMYICVRAFSSNTSEQ